MRFILFVALIIISAPTLYAQTVIDITRSGVGATPDANCQDNLAAPDCQHLNGMQSISVAPGAQVALFIEWRNAGTADFQEVQATDQDNNQVFPTVMQTLFPGQTASRNVFFDAPVASGTYATLITLTATDFAGGQDIDQYRFFITVDQSLPVELTSFEAQLTNKGQVDLTWQTLQEMDNDHFSIERSKNGQTFTEVGAVAGARESRTEQTYTFRDHQPLPGLSFYRLRQVDRDGTSTLSQVLSVEATNEFTLYPNPAKDQLSLAGFAGGRVDIYDSLGRRMLGQNLTKDTALDVAQLTPGRYLLRTDTGSRWWVKQ